MFDVDHLREIWSALTANKARTLLTAFGVFWGIFMLVLLLGSGNGIQNGVNRGFAGTATNSFFVWPQRTSKPYRGLPTGRGLKLTNEDTLALRQVIPEARSIVPVNQLGGYGGGNNVTRGTKAGGFEVLGVEPEVRATESLRLIAGRFLNPNDLKEARKVAVIGRRVQELLFARGEEPIGDAVRINGVWFQVVGTHEPRSSGNDAEQDAQKIYVPLTTFQNSFQRRNSVGWFAVVSKDGIPASAVEKKVLAQLKSRHQVAPDDERAFGHWNTEEEYTKIMGLFSGIRALVWIVGTGTLLAGVIGVSNIMLVIVKERTKEIGVRRAVGATPRWISAQIVVESLLLTASAGYLGLISGMLVLDVVREQIAKGGSPPEMFADPGIALSSALRALAILVVCGTLAGLLPAERAIAIRTAEALRAE